MNKELAELLGWHQNKARWPRKYGETWLSPNRKRWNRVPRFDTDLNAMREVWTVLKERGLWGKFQSAYVNDVTEFLDDEFLYSFLNDLPGQVEAAIKVLKENN